MRMRVRCVFLNCAKNEGMHATEVKEGKTELIADQDGLFRVDALRLYAVNDIEELMIATRHTDTAVKAGEKLAGMRVIPLVIEEKKLKAAKRRRQRTERGKGRSLAFCPGR